MLFRVCGGAWVALFGPLGDYENIEKTFVFVLCFEHLEVLERALEVLGVLVGGPWGVPGRSLRGPVGSLGALGGSLGGSWGPNTRKP